MKVSKLWAETDQAQAHRHRRCGHALRSAAHSAALGSRHAEPAEEPVAAEEAGSLRRRRRRRLHRLHRGSRLVVPPRPPEGRGRPRRWPVGRHLLDSVDHPYCGKDPWEHS